MTGYSFKYSNVHATYPTSGTSTASTEKLYLMMMTPWGVASGLLQTTHVALPNCRHT
jgi:hypothetical protein